MKFTMIHQTRTCYKVRDKKFTYWSGFIVHFDKLKDERIVEFTSSGVGQQQTNMMKFKMIHQTRTC